MAHSQTAPCVNINDEVVQVVSINVKEGEFVKRGDVIGAVETDKSLVDVVAEQDGYVLKIECQPEQKVPVGAVMIWLGEAPDEAVPQEQQAASAGSSAGMRPTGKARAMLKELNLDAARIPARGDRLTVADIETWLAGAGRGHPATLGTEPRASSRGRRGSSRFLEELQPPDRIQETDRRHTS